MRKLGISVSAFALLTLFVLTTPAYAQDNTPPVQSPAGVGVLILLLGLGALVVIGGAYTFSDRAASKRPHNDDDDE